MSLKEEEEERNAEGTEKVARRMKMGPICPKKGLLCVLMPF
jgi:hypothetical protein